MTWLDVLGEVKKLSDAFTLMTERFNRQTETNKETRDEIATLRKEVAELTTRIAVLEASRDAIDVIAQLYKFLS